MLSWLKSISASYLSHLTGYIVAAATIVSGLNPKAVPPQYAFMTALAGVVVNAAHHGYTIANASPIVKAALEAALKAATDAASKVTPVFLALLLTPLMFGCAQLQTATQKTSAVITSPQAQPFIKASAFAAVTAAEQHGITAAQINAVAKAALAADQGAGASLAAVKAVLDTELAKLKLPAGDLVAIGIVEDEFNVYAQSYVSTDPTLASAQAAAADIFQAVILATGG